MLEKTSCTSLKWELSWIPVVLAILGFQAYQIQSLDFNIMEILLGKSLFRGWGYIFAPLDPPGLSRPPLAPVFCGLIGLIVSTPENIFRAFYVLTLFSFSLSVFCFFKKISGKAGAFSALMICFLTPLISRFPWMNSHLASHLALLSIFGWALLSVVKLFDNPSLKTGIISGLSWGVAFLARYELVVHATTLFFGLIILLRNKRPLSRSMVGWFGYLLGFSLIFVPKTFLYQSAAKRFGIISDAGIYTYYHGEVHSREEKPVANSDNLGFILSSKLYGSIESNRESLMVLMANHPRLVIERFFRNAKRGLRYVFTTYQFFFTPFFFLLVLLPASTNVYNDRWAKIFLLLHFAGYPIFLFHVDPRYLITIALPILFLICRASGLLVQYFFNGRGSWRNGVVVFSLALLISAGIQTQPFPLSRPNFVEHESLAFRELGEHLKAAQKKWASVSVALPGEDPFLMAPYVSFYADTAVPWSFEGPVPLDRLAAIRVKLAEYILMASDNGVSPCGQRSEWSSRSDKYGTLFLCRQI